MLADTQRPQVHQLVALHRAANKPIGKMISPAVCQFSVLTRTIGKGCVSISGLRDEKGWDALIGGYATGVIQYHNTQWEQDALGDKRL